MTAKTDNDLVAAYIEFYSADRSRPFRKYCEHRITPQEEIMDLIYSDPDRAARIIREIGASTDDWKIQDALNCGLVWDFKNVTGEEYFERLGKQGS